MDGRVVLVVSLWLKEGAVEAFEAFERRVAKIQARHGGRIERAVRLAAPSDPDAPFEVHVVSFPDAGSLAAYRADPEMQTLGAERAAIFERTVIHEGRDAGPY